MGNKRTEISIEEMREMLNFERQDNAKFIAMGMDIDADVAIQDVFRLLKAYENGKDWRV